MISDHVTNWMGYPVELYSDEDTPANPDYANTIYRIAVGWDCDLEGGILELISKFLADPASAETPGLIIGSFAPENEFNIDPVVEALVAFRDKLPKLRGLFIGDILSEENEISWIEQGSMAPLFLAYPNLEHFRVRGGNNLTLGRLKSDKLKSLVIEAGGLDVGVLREVIAAELPNLEHLEIWLGDDGYGWNGTVEDIAPLLEPGKFPKLKYLGLRDSCIADQVAELVARSPVIAQLDTLDLSLGTLGDEGAEHLLESEHVKKLKKLDLHHHYILPALQEQLKALPFEVDLSEHETEEEYGRYVSVSE